MYSNLVRRYLVFAVDGSMFATDYFDAKNHFTEGMKIVDLSRFKEMIDGEQWQDIQLDHL